MSTPTVPPRPARAQAGPTAVNKLDLPHIPPRPVRKIDPSPDREAYTRSPLNALPGSGPFARPPVQTHPPSVRDDSLRRTTSNIDLPSEVGQEGFEYTSYDQLPPEARVVVEPVVSASAAPVAEQPTNKSVDLPLHAPTASVPMSTAKSRIATVTHTNSTQAAAAGIGKAQPDDDVHTIPADASPALGRVTSRTYDDHPRRVPSAEPHPLRARASFQRSSTSLPLGTSRPPSLQGEHYEGIPEIGMQIPLYPNAGDVQAPSPAPTQSMHPPGIGFFNDGSSRNHHRKRSAKHDFGPPGSYGMHGHGVQPQDQFERDWIAKHPNQAAQENLANFVSKPATALNSDQLNRLVHIPNDIGMGTNREMIGTPSQEIAFDATEQFALRMASPKASPVPLTDSKMRSSSGHQATVEPSLRKQSSPFNAKPHDRPGSALDSEDEHTIHIYPHSRRAHKITGGGAVDGTVNLGPTGGNSEEEGGWIHEGGDGTPILASDEITKRPGSAFLEPAVSPEFTRRDDDYYDSDHASHSRRSSWQPPSRPSSRPGSAHGGYHGGPLHRFNTHEEHHASGMGTPLEEIEEYEPLFPEEESHEKPKHAFRKRPGLAHHHFPSRDIWEDTPSSLQYQTTVETPEPPSERVAAARGAPAKVFETPEQEQRRRDGNPNDMLSNNKTFAKPHFKQGVKHEMHDRPGLQRFPSEDIWEDTPDSMRLVTTVSGPQMDEIKSPPDSRPTTTAPWNKDDPESRSSTGMSELMRPTMPARPERKSKLAHEVTAQDDDARAKEVPDLGGSKLSSSPEKAIAPGIPERPKPNIPPRPARSSNSDQTEGAPLAQTTSATSVGSDGSSETVTSPPVAKAKPVVPARPGGNKIASLKAGFMNDLNSRLQLGPQAPPKVKEPEAEAAAEEAEKAPLADARKSRAKGPARRKPASSPSGAPATMPAGFSMFSPTTLWHIDEAEELNVPTSAAVAPPDVHGAADDAVAATAAAAAAAPLSSPVPAADLEPTSPDTKVALAPHPPGAIGAEGDLPDPSIAPATLAAQQALAPELAAALADAPPPPLAVAEPEPEPAKSVVAASDVVSTAVQTGESTMSVVSPQGETSTLTAFVDGRAPEEGDVVIKDGVQVVPSPSPSSP